MRNDRGLALFLLVLLSIVVSGAWLIGSRSIAFADALSAPASDLRTWEIATSTSSQSVTFSLGTSSLFRSKSVLLVHDTTGGSDVFCSFTSTADASITDGGTTFRLKSGEKINIDGQFSQASFRSASSTPTVRMIVTF